MKIPKKVSPEKMTAAKRLVVSGVSIEESARIAGVPIPNLKAAVKAGGLDDYLDQDAEVAAVPNDTGPEQAKGHRDTRDADIDVSRVSQLLAGVRDGAWLDQQTFPALRYAVPDLLPEGFTVIVGPPKVGKSFFIADTQLSVAAGGRALGKIAVGRPRRVLYLALEDGDRRMQSRCRLLLGDGVKLPQLFNYVTRVAPGEVLPTIEAFLWRYPDTALVVLDTLGKVMPPVSPNETTYGRDYRIGSRIKDIADQTPGLAVVAIHHDRKAGSEDFVERVSGTNGLAGAADTIVVLARKRQSVEGLLMVTGRDVPEAEYALKMLDGVKWTLDGADLAEAATNAKKREESAAGQISDLSAQIIDFVRKHKSGVSRGDVVKQFGEHAGRYLTRHVDAGRLVRLGRGLYGVPSVPVSQAVQHRPADQPKRLRLAWDSDADCPNCGCPFDSPEHEIKCEGDEIS